MPVKNIDGILCIVRLELTPEELPGLRDRHKKNYPGAKDREKEAKSVIQNGFKSVQTMQFIENVCRWGKGDRLIPEFKRNNTPKEVCATLREAWTSVCSEDVVEAVTQIQTLHQLGQAFASKVLRFMSPTKAVILDRVIRTHLGYAATPTGYRDFLADCKNILEAAQKSDVIDAKFPLKLRVCDIEAAIFAKIQKY
jgi:hypothetical protein